MKVNELEKSANAANWKYRKKKKALILKVPVPILYTRKGLIAQTRTVDYTGLVPPNGRFVAFDAKETQIKTSFPLKNIKQHQLMYLELVEELGGLAFFLIHFKKMHKRAFVTPISLVSKYWYGDGRKSIPYNDFKDEWLVKADDYLTLLTDKDTWIYDL